MISVGIETNQWASVQHWIDKAEQLAELPNKDHNLSFLKSLQVLVRLEAAKYDEVVNGVIDAATAQLAPSDVRFDP
jgi:hypothetical protein